MAEQEYSGGLLPVLMILLLFICVVAGLAEPSPGRKAIPETERRYVRHCIDGYLWIEFNGVMTQAYAERRGRNLPQACGGEGSV